jgi:hypothetical protein
MSYHKRPIAIKGKVGEFSKIEEEMDEVRESLEQGNRVMTLCELSDLYGAISSFLETEFSGFTMKDLKKMSNATKRAFKSGSRK